MLCHVPDCVASQPHRSHKTHIMLLIENPIKVENPSPSSSIPNSHPSYFRPSIPPPPSFSSPTSLPLLSSLQTLQQDNSLPQNIPHLTHPAQIQAPDPSSPLTSLLQTSISLRPSSPCPSQLIPALSALSALPHIPLCPPSPFPLNVSVPQLAGRRSLVSASSFASPLALLCNSYITGMACVRAILEKGFEMSDGRWDAGGEIPLGFWRIGD